jgi:hypothetical protein
MIFTFPEINSGKLQSRSDWADNNPVDNFIETIKKSGHNFTEGNRSAFEKYQKLYETISFESDSLEPTANLFHRNYLNYLEKCWANHLGIVITPDIIWYTILSEFVSIIKSSPETFRHLFTTSTTKKLLVVQAGGNEMPLDELVNLIKTEVPTDTSIFFPNFGFTKNSNHAFYAAFCDMCSPYYDYSMLLCGFPFIKVKGTIDDWKLLKDNWTNLSNILQNTTPWKTIVDNIFNDILTHFNNQNFWKQIFSSKKCGSGHQTTISGWLSNLYIIHPELKYTKNYSSHISSVKYNNIQTEQHYEMTVGLFNSTQIDEFMEPSFSSIIYNMTNYVSLSKELQNVNSHH